jgi:hypothetical protein
MNNYNAEKYLDEYEHEQKEGFKVEVKRPGTRGKGPAPEKNKKGGKKSFVDKFG